MSKKLFQLLLDPQRAKRMATHLRNLRLDYSSSEVGGVICIQISCLDSDIKDVRACLDEINTYYNINTQEQENENEMEAF